MSNRQILFLLDSSGSMDHVREITVGGFNAWKRTLELIENDVRVTLTTFDDGPPQVVYDSVPARKIRDMVLGDFIPRNYTALYDALKREAARVETKHMKQGDTALVIILTDGYDNASATSPSEIKGIVHEYMKKGWSFLYLSSDSRYLEYASHMGLSEKNCVFFHASNSGTEAAYKEITRASMSYTNGEQESLETWEAVFNAQMKDNKE